MQNRRTIWWCNVTFNKTRPKLSYLQEFKTAKNQASMSKELPVELWYRIVFIHRSGEEFRKKRNMLQWRFTEAWSLHYLYWKKFETTRTLPRAGLLATLSNWWSRALVRVVTKKLMVTLVELHDHIWRWEKLTERQTLLQHSTDLGLITVWSESIFSSVKTHENPLEICKKKNT